MNRVLAALLLSLALCGSCPTRVAAAECLALAHTYQRIDALILKHGGKREILQGKAAQDYLDVVNAEPPATHFEGDFLVLWEHDDFTALGLMRSDGLVCAIGHIGPKIHEQAIRAAKGLDT